MNSNITISFCNGHKESFMSFPPTRKKLAKCFERRGHSNKNKTKNSLVYAHVKPTHIKNYQEATEVIKFINHAYTAGFKLIIVNKRQNALARAISSAELKYEDLLRASARNPNKHKELIYNMNNRFSNPSNLISFIQANYVAIELGRLRAQILNMTILEVDFVDLTQNMCGIAKKIAILMQQIGYIKKEDLKRFNCIETSSTSFKSNPYRAKGLVERIGPDAAEAVTKYFSNSSYSWMLNLTATEWPDVTTNPCHFIKNCLRNSTGNKIEQIVEGSVRLNEVELGYNSST